MKRTVARSNPIIVRIMAQGQIDEIKAGHFHKRKEVSCQVDDHLSLIVKRRKNITVVVLEKGSRPMALPLVTYQHMCGFQSNVALLHDFLYGRPGSCYDRS